MRFPTTTDYNNYDGAHCHRLWAELDDDWVCPCCKRTKRLIMRWTTRRLYKYVGNKMKDKVVTKTYKGWMAGLHGHHDHAIHSCLSPHLARFPETIICDHCNCADGSAKRKLGLPKDFSFSPSEIGEFVKSYPHRGHKIDYEKAKEIYLTKHTKHSHQT